MATENAVYVTMLADTLMQKEKLLHEILANTKAQESLFLEKTLDIDSFHTYLKRKGEQIEQLNQLDEGFDALFQRVEKEVVGNRAQYKDIILQMQNSIRVITDLGTQIQALEQQNSGHFKVYLSKERKPIRDYHVTNKIASNYYQNMGRRPEKEQSFFFDQQK